MKSSGDTKQRLIDTTRKMIDTDGIDSVSMRDLGKILNLSRSAVYIYFKNKEDLLAAIVTENFEFLKNQISGLMTEIREPRNLIFEILCTFYNFGINNQEHFKLMFLKNWDQNQYHSLHTAAIEVFGLFYKSFEATLEQQYTINIPPEKLTAMVASFVLGLVEFNSSGHMEPEKGFDDSSSLINSFVDLIFT